MHQPVEIGVGRLCGTECRHGSLGRGLLGDFLLDHLVAVWDDFSGRRVDDFFLGRRVPEQLKNDIYRQLLLCRRRGCLVVIPKQFFDLIVVARQNSYDVTFGHCGTSPGHLVICRVDADFPGVPEKPRLVYRGHPVSSLPDYRTL